MLREESHCPVSQGFTLLWRCVSVNLIWTFLLERIPLHVLNETDAAVAPQRSGWADNYDCCPLTNTPLWLCVNSSSYSMSQLISRVLLSWWQVLESWWRWVRQRPVSLCSLHLPSPSTEGCRCPSRPWRAGGSRCGWSRRWWRGCRGPRTCGSVPGKERKKESTTLNHTVNSSKEGGFNCDKKIQVKRNHWDILHGFSLQMEVPMMKMRMLLTQIWKALLAILHTFLRRCYVPHCWNKLQNKLKWLIPL